jgi:DNA-binding NtrC family response regulator
MDRQMWTADDAPTAPDPPSRPYLVHALSCDRPSTPPSRWSLTRVADVVLSGAGPLSATRAGALTIACDDPWASTRHAALKRTFGSWFIEDLDSRNGTTVNGERVSRRQLEDGDLIETGHTAWWFRDLATGMPPPDQDALDLAAPFVTMHAPLEAAATRASAALVAGLPVFVEGEPGSGKQSFVAAIHAGSRRPGALIEVDCTALPTEHPEAALLGHRRDALAGMSEECMGYILAANRGTLFLREVGDLPPAGQVALLRVLTKRSVTPFGDERSLPVDLAVVSTTRRDLQAMVAAGTFRADLLARLRGVALWIPPLRERPEDIGVFVARTIARVAPGATLQLEVARRLLTATWPHNVRELEHVVATAVLRANARAVEPGDLEGVEVPPSAAEPADAALRARLVNALVSTGGNISAVARELGRDRKQIHRWIASLAIDLRDPR